MVRTLVTGAAGSIGGALLAHLGTQVATQAVGLDLKPGPGVLMVDIRDRLALRRMMLRFRPEVVFHAAAMKHVPELESMPFAAVASNVFGTVNVACAAREAGVRKVILLSTDKAVRPASIMGKTKRLAEQVFLAMDDAPGAFTVVRLGNVLGSSGSVLPIWEAQLAAGGPLTVTHPDMQRFFLTPEQAVAALLRAEAKAQGGEVFVPHMGSPESILALAHRVLGNRPIRVHISGVRPGEKLSEELYDPDREYLHREDELDSVYRPYCRPSAILQRLDALRQRWAANDRDGLVQLLTDIGQENSEN